MQGSTYVGAGDGLDKSGLAVSDVTDGADVNGGLAGNDLGVQGSQQGGIELVEGLASQVSLVVDSGLGMADDVVSGEVDKLKLVCGRSRVDLFSHLLTLQKLIN